ncbi:SEC14-like protein 2 [Pseudolycoriella hygida]|uniref:SEC14-like protein 2 n=1 Tax=Pseudolycoriella hygida TaxID=35572 RepID=A0A9Q0N3S8_9DIPT|nr:SEC14-like protein 2 [Pseudolycoriella hygida]
MLIRSPILQDDQKFSLMKFRRAITDVTKPEHDDFFLIRWLNARNWNIENAEKMFRDSIKWRERWNVDDIANWKVPKPLLDFTPHGLSGFDKDGCPIIIIPFAGMDMWGILHTVSRADFIRATIQNIEKYLKIGLEQSKIHGPQARQFVILFDMEGFSLKQYTWRPAAEVVISLIKMYEANYPEILKCCFIINVPKVFAFVYNIIKNFLDTYTLSKIFIFKNDSKKWLPKLLEHVDESQLPTYFGGQMTDDDGNPKCLSKICWGGKIPEELYTDKNDSLTNNEDFVDTTVKKGGKIKLELNCEEDHHLLKVNNKTGEESVELPLQRVASHQLDEEGFITCQKDFTYHVLFDNTYSFFKSKRIRYSVVLVKEQNVDELEAAADKICNNTQK